MGYCPPGPSFTTAPQVFPPSALATNNIPPLLSVHVTYTLFPTDCTLGSKPAPNSFGVENEVPVACETIANEEMNSKARIEIESGFKVFNRNRSEIHNRYLQSIRCLEKMGFDIFRISRYRKSSCIAKHRYAAVNLGKTNTKRPKTKKVDRSPLHFSCS